EAIRRIRIRHSSWSLGRPLRLAPRSLWGSSGRMEASGRGANRARVGIRITRPVRRGLWLASIREPSLVRSPFESADSTVTPAKGAPVKAAVRLEHQLLSIESEHDVHAMVELSRARGGQRCLAAALAARARARPLRLDGRAEARGRAALRRLAL